MVNVQGLQRYVLLHQLDVRSELKEFFQRHPHLQFRLVFLDAGSYDIVAASIREFWPRLTPGGVMIFDQFNYEVAPGETRAVKELLPSDKVIRTFPNGWMPTAYVVK
jgi:predicted O-methyltransferase YrrM